MIKNIQYLSSEYQEELNLRNRILREPLNLKLTDRDIADDASDFHVGFFKDEKLVACLILTPKGRMRQVAVDFDYQKQGIGKFLVQYCEELAKRKNIPEITLRARDSAVKFYESLGYHVEGTGFSELGNAHFNMRKKLV